MHWAAFRLGRLATSPSFNKLIRPTDQHAQISTMATEYFPVRLKKNPAIWKWFWLHLCTKGLI